VEKESEEEIRHADAEDALAQKALEICLETAAKIDKEAAEQTDEEEKAKLVAGASRLRKMAGDAKEATEAADRADQDLSVARHAA
jgi:hypothetical protein